MSILIELRKWMPLYFFQLEKSLIQKSGSLDFWSCPQSEVFNHVVQFSCSISQETPENIHQLFESVVVKGWLSKVTKKFLWVISSHVFRHDCFWKTENHISQWPPNLCICMHLTSNAFKKWSIVQVRSPKQEKTPKELEEMLS